MGKSLVVITAAVAGFVGGILLAPKSGKEMRQDIMHKKDEIQDKAQRSLNSIKKNASTIKDDVKSSVDDVKVIAAQHTKQ
ncbi:MAG: hypothetical protein JWN26_663 [Candidatus Saccharibacteria bacterium]|nr:hypothetical protein [Candidatus Saccharibacteria bacterium]